MPREADQIFRDLQLPTTFLRASFYWDNLIHFGMGPKKAEDDRLVFTLPMGDKKLPGIASEDIGKCAYGIFKKGSEHIGKTIGIAGEHPTGAQMAAALSRALGREVRYQAISPDAYRAMGFPGAADLGNRFQFYQECEVDFCKSRDPKIAKVLNPALQSFEDWLKLNGGQIRI